MSGIDLSHGRPMRTRGNPFEEMERLFERMSRQFDRAAERWEAESPLSGLGGRSMAVDLVEQDEAYVVAVDLPGYERDDVTVRVADSTLRVEAEHDEVDESESIDGRYVHQERRHESAKRSIDLPGEVDADGVEARMKNGVLTVTLPKREISEAKSIDISGE